LYDYIIYVTINLKMAEENNYDNDSDSDSDSEDDMLELFDTNQEINVEEYEEPLSFRTLSLYCDDDDGVRRERIIIRYASNILQGTDTNSSR
jgi:hypothetical protein